ncbi:hypothetical protein HYC85_005302 [Camellia sinensis]|uniref:DUF241 domain-containing protein n=1 Tax=Camellia sinensis TaxID=4442 RepID=A0A7J7I0A4_CAMSI|nr:hypothetical protein HYC85_005302 [Camellia sinensis]
MGSSSKTKRSISLPCRSHPSAATIEEELNKIKTWKESSTPTAKSISNGLSRLEDLYKCMENFLNLPLTQHALFHHQHEKWIGDLQDGFVSLLDICGTERDAMTQIKEHVRDLQSALRRRKGDSSIETCIAKYTRFRKNAKKDAKKLITAMKQIGNKIEATPLLELDQHVSSVIKVLREAVAGSICILHSLLLFLSVPILKSKPTRRSLVSKLLYKGAVACENHLEEKVNELESVDVALHNLCRSDLSEGDKMQIAQNSLKSLEASIEDVENALECLFRSHPSTVRIEEELNKIKTWESSSTPTAEAISNSLSRLEDLNKCMQDLLNLPLTQQALSHHHHEKWIGDLQDGFVSLLDICGTERDVMTQIKEHVRDLQSALRRRKGDSSIEISIAKYTCFRKNTKKDAKKLIAVMKHMDNKIEATPLLELDQDISSLIKALREVVAASISILHSVLLFLSMPILKSKSTRWSLVSKLLQKGEVACENQENVNELESVDVALHSLCRSDSNEGDKMQSAQNSLKSLEARIEDVENVLECLFRRFVKARATLLNIVSHQL